jgi:hypothetical protein
MIRQVLFALALCGVGCGGTVLGASKDGGSDAADGSTSDACENCTGEGGTQDAPGPGDTGVPWSPVCPEEEPTAGSPCSIPEMMDNPSVLCEYGKLQYDVSCDAVYLCAGDGHWSKNTTGSSCQPDGPNSPSCPATYADIQADGGGACSVDGLRCEYPDAVCTCSSGFGGPIEVDGGTSWYCNPGPTCPMPRPRLGAACSGSGQNCTYVTCEFAESCQDGFWHAEFEACAVPGGSP